MPSNVYLKFFLSFFIFSLTIFTFVHPHEEEKKNIHPTVEKFLRQQLILGGIKDQESLDIIKEYRWGGGIVAGKKVLWVKEHDRLKWYLRCKKYAPSFLSNIKFISSQGEHNKTIKVSINEYLHQAAAVIHHEAGHILLNHHDLGLRDKNYIQKIEEYSFAFRLLCAPLAFLCESKITSLLILSALLFIPLDLSTNIPFCYSRYRERKADANVAENIHLLKAFKHYLQNYYFLHPEFVDSDNNKFSTHPHPKERIENIKKRIQALKAKNDPKTFEDPLARCI